MKHWNDFKSISKLDILRLFFQRRSPCNATFLGCASMGLWPPNSNSAEIFVQFTYTPKFHRHVCTRLEVIVLTNTHTHKQTNKQTLLKTSKAVRYSTTLCNNLILHHNHSFKCVHLAAFTFELLLCKFSTHGIVARFRDSVAIRSSVTVLSVPELWAVMTLASKWHCKLCVSWKCVHRIETFYRFLLSWLSYSYKLHVKMTSCLCVCLNVNQDVTNRNCYTQRLVILHAQTY